MKILEAKIDWVEHYDNLPSLELLVDKMPKWDEWRFKRHWFLLLSVSEEKWHDDQYTPCAFWATKDGLVNFFHHTPTDEKGFGGRIFEGACEDGSKFQVKGPWSSNAMSMNQFFPPSHEVILKERDGQFPNLGYSSAMLASEFITQVRSTGNDVVVIDNYGAYGQISDKFRAKEIIARILAEPLMCLNEQISLAIVKPGMNLEQSQKAKRVYRDYTARTQ